MQRVESDWKKLISTYLLFFEYGEKSYCIVRQGKKFRFLRKTETTILALLKQMHFINIVTL